MPESLKILFLCEAQLGDLLLLTPALRALKSSLPYAKITLLLLHRREYSGADDSADIKSSRYTGTSQVFLNNPDIDEILELNRSSIRKMKGLSRIKAELNCIRFIKQKKFDAVICTFPQSRLIIWSFLAGIKKRIGQKDQPFSFLLTQKPDINTLTGGVLKYYCSLLKPLGINSWKQDLIFNISEEEKKSASGILNKLNIDEQKPLVLIHPGASEKHKILPPSYFAGLCRFILNNNLAEIIICGTNYDREVINSIVNLSGQNIKVFFTESLRELASLIIHSKLCLVNNSGPRHLAAALGCINISFFQKFDNGEWGIYHDENNIIAESDKSCIHCRENRCRSIIPEGQYYGSKCIQDIDLKPVMEKIKDILQKKS